MKTGSAEKEKEKEIYGNKGKEEGKKEKEKGRKKREGKKRKKGRKKREGKKRKKGVTIQVAFERLQFFLFSRKNCI
ncbi:hypothetical protein MSWH1_0467 [Methanosarcina sp. WH1]|nr:hypothetical protein MSWH1_0467 [Methanosarcina sp. WH1]